MFISEQQGIGNVDDLLSAEFAQAAILHAIDTGAFVISCWLML